jgi:two-component system response regulator CpxR
VVLDVMLPDGSGLELLKQLRSEHADLPVLMLSARGEPLDRILGLELGADDYLAKPCDPRELTARLRAVLRRSHPSAPTSQIELGDLVFSPVRGVVSIDQREMTLRCPKAVSSKPCCASPANRWTSRNWRRSAWAAS